jgi:hypothetical protein
MTCCALGGSDLKGGRQQWRGHGVSELRIVKHVLGGAAQSNPSIVSRREIAETNHHHVIKRDHPIVIENNPGTAKLSHRLPWEWDLMRASYRYTKLYI